MKKIFSLLTVLALILCCTACGSQTMETTESTIPEGSYIMIPVNPDSVYSSFPVYQSFPESAYVTDIDGTGNLQLVAVCTRDPEADNRIVMNTLDGHKAVVHIDDGHYSFEKTISKTRSCYAEDDTLLWEITVTATFLYDLQSVKCTDVTGEVYVAAENSWYVISETPVSEGNTASYTVEFGRSALGVTTSSSCYTITVSCDENGKLT